MTTNPNETFKAASIGLTGFLGEYGYAVALDETPEATTAILGAPNDDANSLADSGLAEVWVRSTTVSRDWDLQATLTPGDAEAGDLFGSSVSVSGDTAVVGAPGKAGVRGAVYVFVRSGATWTEQQKLVAPSAAASDAFGFSVAIYGETLVVGKPGSAANAAVYVYERSGSTWTLNPTTPILAPVAGIAFGRSVDIDVDTILVGSRLSPGNVAGTTGTAYVYTRSGVVWSLEDVIPAPVSGHEFSFSVAVSGNTAVIGTDTRFSAAINGRAWTYERAGTTWSSAQELANPVPTTATPSSFGLGVAISGNTIAVGDAAVNAGEGATIVFMRPASGQPWTQTMRFTADAGAGPNRLFGFAVAAAKTTVLAGAPASTLTNEHGCAYFLDFGLPPIVQCSVSPACVAVGEPVTMTGAFADPDSEQGHSALVFWDFIVEPVGLTPTGPGTGTATASHVFSEPVAEASVLFGVIDPTRAFSIVHCGYVKVLSCVELMDGLFAQLRAECALDACTVERLTCALERARDALRDRCGGDDYHAHALRHLAEFERILKAAMARAFCASGIAADDVAAGKYGVYTPECVPESADPYASPRRRCARPCNAVVSPKPGIAILHYLMRIRRCVKYEQSRWIA